LRIAFVQDNGLNESLNLTDLAALLKTHNHAYELFLERNERDLVGAIRRFAPDVFVIPCDILGHTKAVSLANMIKDAFDKPIIMPGTHATLYPEIAKEPSVDYIIRGEAEYALLEMLDRLDHPDSILEIENVGVFMQGELRLAPLRPLLQDLDVLPMPDRGMYYKYRFLRDATTKRFTSGRGCPHTCSFCYNPLFREIYRSRGHYVRKKSVGRVVDEILAVRSKYPLLHVHFSDDLFPVSPKWVAEFSEAYRRRVAIPFSMNASVDLLTEEMIQQLADAGCHSIALGLESGVERIRQWVLNKTYTNEDLYRICRKITNCGIKLLTSNVIGLPGESIEDAFSTIRVNQEIGAVYARVYLMFPVYRTKLYNFCIEEGYLNRSDWEAYDYLEYIEKHGFSQNSILKIEDKRQFEVLLHFFTLLVMFPWLGPLVRCLIRGPRLGIYRILDGMIPFQEKRFFRITWLSGLRFFMNTGSPARKTKNFNNYIP
jgi:anaerobic magnesium-protoporphyrin IX monomethyl ester cyclase